MKAKLPIDPKALITFRAVCAEGSISAAARALNISQPSVSNTIATLEHRLGATLFTRSRTGITLTAEGQALRWQAEAMTRLVDGAADVVANARANVAGPLRIGGTPGALVSMLPEAARRLEASIGPFNLSVLERPDHQLVDLLRRGDVELAMVTTQIGAIPSDIVEETCARDPFALVVGRHHRTLADPISLRDLRDLPWVLPEAEGAFRRQVDALFTAAELPMPRNVIRCDSLLTTKAIVRSSDRVTILPRAVAAAEISVGVLRPITIREALFDRNIGVRYLRDRGLSPLAEALLATLRVQA